jgi:hypothetical protein
VVCSHYRDGAIALERAPEERRHPPQVLQQSERHCLLILVPAGSYFPGQAGSGERHAFCVGK